MKPGKTIALTFGVGLMLISTGCSASDGSESAGSAVTVPSTTVMATAPATTALATTTSTTMDETAAVLAAIEGFNTAFEQAVVAPEAGATVAQNFTTPGHLGSLEDLLAEYATIGSRGGGQILSRVLEIRIDGNRAEVDQCQLDATFLLDTDGIVVVAADESALLIRTLLLRIGGQWLVDSERYFESDGSSTCLVDTE